MPDSLLEVLPDQAVVLDELRELLPGLRQAVLAAKDRMELNPVKNRAVHCATTTAGSMVNYMVAEAKFLFTGNPRVFFRDDEETWLVIDQRYDLRFKKLSNGGVPQNARTGRQRRITSQSRLRGFHLVRLNVGWGEDHMGEFQVLMSFSTGFGAVGWCVEIRDDGVFSLSGDPLLPFDGDLPHVRAPADPYDLSNPGESDGPARRVRPRTVPLPDTGDIPRRRVKPAVHEEVQPEDAGDRPVRKSDE
jgi:hypothetical protein